jgi:anti-sigma28 factor (negative regulator of flagellin synthesis)
MSGEGRGNAPATEEDEVDEIAEYAKMKLAKAPPFEGKQSEFPKWWIKMGAHADRYGYRKALKVQKEDDLPDSEEEVIPAGKHKAKAARWRNKTAITCFSDSFQTYRLLSWIPESATTAYPGGLTWKIVARLMKTFAPDDMTSRVELRLKLNQLALKEKEDPEVLTERVAELKQRFNQGTVKINEEELIAALISGAPKKYESSINVEKRLRGKDLTYEHVIEAMGEQFRLSVARNFRSGTKRWADDDDSDSDQAEPTLLAFQGKCYICKQDGHRAYECPQKDEAKVMQCDLCHKKGHTKERCWENPEYKGKRPPYWHRKQAKKNSRSTEAAALAVEDNDDSSDGEMILASFDVSVRYDGEVILANMLEFPKSIKLLSDPDIWIADSGASTHSTGSRIGMTNVQPAKNVQMVLANSHVLSCTEVGEIHGRLYNKCGVYLQDVLLERVKYVPDQAYNLFSTTRLTSNGWTPGANKKSIWFENSGQRITFDIEIKTKDGVVYAAYIMRQTDTVFTSLDGTETQGS